MKSTVETLSPTRVRLEIEVPFAELEPSLKKAYRVIGSKVNVPGFRRGKIPTAIIDQRVGRGAVLEEAVNDVLPEQFLAAVREHEVKTIGRPEVEVRELSDGEFLKFTAEVDVRPELVMPDLATIEVPISLVEVTDADIDEQVANLRERFATLKTTERPAQDGDYVQLDLAATVDGVEVPGGTATNISHEVGSGQLVPGLDTVLVGMVGGTSATFETQLVGGDFTGRDANVAVTVRTVKEKQLPELNDEFAQMASEFDTLDEIRADLRGRLERSKRTERLFEARDKAVQALIDATGVPAPESVVTDEVAHRKETMTAQLDRMGATLADYLAAESRTEEDLDTELNAAASNAIQVQLVLDSLADAENVTVTDDEFGHEVVHRAKRANLAPEKYYEQLVRAGTAGAVFGDVRRGKALSLLMERIRIVDTEGNQVSLESLRDEAGAEDEHNHDD